MKQYPLDPGQDRGTDEIGDLVERWSASVTVKPSILELVVQIDRAPVALLKERWGDNYTKMIQAWVIDHVRERAARELRLMIGDARCKKFETRIPSPEIDGEGLLDLKIVLEFQVDIGLDK